MKAYRSERARKGIIETYDKLLALWNVEIEERDVSTTYGTTHMIECGKEDAPPLVLFHGVGDDSALMWLYNAEALSRHFRLYAVDTLGGPGKSIFNSAYDKNFDDVLWINEIMNALGLKKASFMGVSHGGYLVQLYTLHRPEKVDKAICLASAVPAGESGDPLKLMMKIFLPEALFPTKKNVIKLLKKLSGGNYHVFTQNETVMEHYTWLLKGFNNMAMRYHKVGAFTDAEVSAIRDRIVYIAGLNDPFQKMGGEAAMRAYDMNVRFYDGVGHGINHEIADEINKTIIDILTGQ